MAHLTSHTLQSIMRRAVCISSCARPWPRNTTRTQSVLQSLVITLVLCLVLWAIFSEFGVYYWKSSSWRWPSTHRREASLNILEDETSDKQTKSVRTYFQTGDTHHYEILAASRNKVRRRDSGNTDREKDAEHLLKVLILSDPHVMCGSTKEEWWPARWDADHYLKTSFSFLYPLFRPDLVIFLGDIFSNGFEASQSEWNQYIQCLKDIYPVFTSSEREKLIVAMGDNDLGGEGSDYMSEASYRRYEETFGDLNIVFQITAGIKIIKITTVCFLRQPVTAAEVECRESLIRFLDSFQDSARKPSPLLLTILVSHVPLNLLETGHTVQHRGQMVDIKTKILLSLRPGIIVSGHVHHEEYTLHSVVTAEGGHVIANEITVPTCSYRMGEMLMGVGTAVISEGGSMSYRVNWLPPRYPSLMGYLILFFLLVVVCYIIFVIKRSKQNL